MTKYAQDWMVAQVKARVSNLEKEMMITNMAATGRRIDLNYIAQKKREMFMARKPRALLMVKAGR